VPGEIRPGQTRCHIEHFTHLTTQTSIYCWVWTRGHATP